MNMRNTVITKCMHCKLVTFSRFVTMLNMFLAKAFCRNCVNERISSRQRKCPACNLPFSQGEVQQVYFQ